MGHLGQIDEPGSFFASRAGDVPVVVTRAEDGEVRSFLNVCRHRGSVIVDGEGKRASLQCPYHAWTYGLDGALRAAPRADETAPREELGLIPLRVASWGPFLFVNPESEGPSLEETVGELWDAIPARRARVPPPDRVRARVELEGRVRELPRVLPLRGRASRLLGGDRRVRGRVPAAAAPVALVPVRPRARTTATLRGQFHFVWPNLKVNVYPGRAEPLDRAGRGPKGPSARVGSSTTSSRPGRTSRGSATCWSSTTRSAARTPRSSSASRRGVRVGRPHRRTTPGRERAADRPLRRPGPRSPVPTSVLTRSGV